jgi:hypothetical protein
MCERVVTTTLSQTREKAKKTAGSVRETGKAWHSCWNAPARIGWSTSKICKSSKAIQMRAKDRKCRKKFDSRESRENHGQRKPPKR